LAAPAFANDGQCLAAGNRQIQVAEHGLAAEDDAELAQFNQCVGRFLRILLLLRHRSTSGQIMSCMWSSPMLSPKSSIKIITNDSTNAAVAARPTPSAPGAQ